MRLFVGLWIGAFAVLALAIVPATALSGPFVPTAPRAVSTGDLPRSAAVSGTEWPAHLQGSIIYTYHEATPPSSAVPFAPGVLDWEWTVTMHVRLDFDAVLGAGAKYRIAEGTWEVSGVGSGRVEWDMGRETCSQTANGQAKGAGTFPSASSQGTVLLGADGLATLSFGLEGGHRGYQWEIVCSVGAGKGEITLDGSWGSFSAATDLNLRGTWAGEGSGLTVALDGAAEWAYEDYPFTRFNTTWQGGLGPRTLRLLVELEDYDRWRPAGSYTSVTEAPAAGSTLKIRARLAYDDGGPVDLHATSFAFSLFESSREPGVAMNHPIFSTVEEDYDLRFEAGKNLGLTVSGGGLEAVAGAGGAEATAILSSFDWGAWGDLIVTADMGGGWKLYGQLEGGPDSEFIPIPKRETGSRIATSWLRATGVEGQPDDADADDRPAGDGPGDGLTLYEEYRGFYENGRHLSTNPLRKDLFIFDEVGGVTKRAITMFERATDLAIHHEFRRGEYMPDRVVNPKAGRGARRGDQHGIRLISGGSDRDLAIQAVGASGAPTVGTPGRIEAIRIPRLAAYLGGAIKASDPVAQQVVSLLARELGHAVNVHDHSERKDFTALTWRVLRDAEGRYLRDVTGDLLIEEVDAGGIFVRDESGIPFVPRRLQQTGRLYIPVQGIPGGPHAGDDSCFMRAAESASYRSAHETLLRYYGFSEPTGTRMCASPRGTGVNDPGRYPQSRYGSAEHGDCLHQIRVRDLSE